MANVALDRIINTVTLRLAGTTAGGIKNEMFSVFDEFLQESGAWTDTFTFTTKADTTDYPVAVAAGQIIRLAWVQDQDGSRIPALMPDRGVVSLQSAPNPGLKFTAKLILTVVDPVTRDTYPLVPTEVATKYNNTLLDGVLGHMLSQSNKPYSNEQLAVYHLRRFRNGIAQARVAVLRAATEGAQAWRFPQSFAVRGQRP